MEDGLAEPVPIGKCLRVIDKTKERSHFTPGRLELVGLRDVNVDLLDSGFLVGVYLLIVAVDVELLEIDSLEVASLTERALGVNTSACRNQVNQCSLGVVVYSRRQLIRSLLSYRPGFVTGVSLN